MSKKVKAKVKAKEKPVEKYLSIKGLLLCAGAVACFLSLLSFSYSHPDAHNWLGWTGFNLGKIFHFLFGVGSYFFCFYFALFGWRMLFAKPTSHPLITSIYVCVLVVSLCFLLCLVEDQSKSLGFSFRKLFYPYLSEQKTVYHLGGYPFYYLYHDLPGINLKHIFNVLGVALLFSTTFFASLLFLTETKPTDVLKAVVAFYNYLKESWKPQENKSPKEDKDNSRFVSLRIPGMSSSQNSIKEQTVSTQEMLAIQPETNLTVRPSLSQKAQTERKPKEKSEATTETASKSKRQAALDAQQVHNGDFKKYSIPAPNLLTIAKKIDQSSLKQDLKRQAEVLEETLLSFGIEAKVGQINCGPTITSFEVHPSIGVKVQKIKTLENDIALNMEAKSIRIIAPIPGKAAVGIEVPNAQPQEVGFKEMLTAYQQGGKKFHVPILLGKAVNGDYVMNDLAKMPHCIIAGATGSGKSVCINTIVMAILMNARPDEIKLIMVDPKKVELTPYTKLPHMLAPVITEPQGACAALNWLVKEMENRYEILKHLGVRNIEAFNGRTINKTLEESLEMKIPVRMPYIVVIIDELADLMMVASNDIETPIARIAQMARAVGIHMILATQRPSREVITGLIKANFPTRISFKVASRVNSQIILDEVGAEALLGNGDMLFLPPGSSTLIRAQGAFIRDDDIAAVVKQICDQAPPNYVIQSFDALGREEVMEKALEDAPNDSLYDQAAQIVLSSGNASTTFLQRKLKIGYARAASLVDELEANGVVEMIEGGKTRKVKKRDDADEGDAVLAPENTEVIQ